MVILKDSMIIGFISGCIGGIAMNVVDWIGYLVGFHDERLLDWGAVTIFGRLANNLPEAIFAQVGQILFGGLVGILYTLVILKLAAGNHPIKGWIYGFLTWFFIYSISIMYDLPHMDTHESVSIPVTHFLSASTYGLVLGLTIDWIEKKTGT